ncbi:hypothetical protein AKO1_010491 [Acrasis kona]|uniref:FMP27 C-terminal domain-containing protein n=1 Tax=Acrasis kona TaxID=1008807 RepID=A0AAW2ZJ43_9EUKA
MMIRAQSGRVHVHDVLERKRLRISIQQDDNDDEHNITEVVTVLDDVKGYMVDYTKIPLDQCWGHDQSRLDQIITSGNVVCTYAERKSKPNTCSKSGAPSSKNKQNEMDSKLFEEAPKNVFVEVPQMDLMFTSSNLQTLIDMITNTMIPKKVARTVLLEDKLETIVYQSKLAPEFWQDMNSVKNKCEKLRREIRHLENQLVSSLRDLKRSQTINNASSSSSINADHSSTTNKARHILIEVERLEDLIRKKKMMYHGMKETLQSTLVNAMRKEEETDFTGQGPDILIQVTVHNARFQMLDSFIRRPFMELILTLFQATVIKFLDYSILQTFTLHHFLLNNLLPNPSFAQVIVPHELMLQAGGSSMPNHLYGNQNGQQLYSLLNRGGEDDYMLRVTANKKSPVGGIGGFEHLEIDLAPINIQLTHEIYKAIWDYAFPLASNKPTTAPSNIIRSDTSTSTPLPMHIMMRNEQAKEMIEDVRRRQEIVGQLDEKGRSQNPFRKLSTRIRHANSRIEDDVEVMKYRANRTVIFNYIRIAEVKLYVTYHGVPESVDTLELIKYVTNLEQCEVHLRTIVYNSKMWTWTGFFENLRNDVIRQSLEYIIPRTVRSFTSSKFKDLGRIFKLGNSHQQQQQQQHVGQLPTSPVSPLGVATVVGKPIRIVGEQGGDVVVRSPVVAQTPSLAPLSIIADELDIDEDSTASSKSESDGSGSAKSKILTRAKKYQQHVKNIKGMLKRKKGADEAASVDDNSVKKMLIFGTKNKNSNEGVKKSLFGKSYKKTNTPAPDTLPSPRFSGKVEGAMTEDLFDTLQDYDDMGNEELDASSGDGSSGRI